MHKKRTRRLNAAQERDLGERIRSAEQEALGAIRHIPCAEAILDKKLDSSERTRYGSVNRLGAAVDAVWQAAQEDRDLLPRAREAKEAWTRSVHLRWELAMSGRRIAHGEARKMAIGFLDEQDLIQEGYIGLLDAAKRFEPSRGLRFSTYARWWVRSNMTRAIDSTGRAVRLSSSAVEQLRNLRKAIDAFDNAGESYTVSDLAQEVGISVRRARVLLSHGVTVSLDEPYDEDGQPQRALDKYLSDEETLRPEQRAIHAQEIDRMYEAFDEVLTERHRHILRRRYGLEDHYFSTLNEVSEDLALSRERVRQLEREALIRLRRGSRIREVA